jgi:predicted GH43/DUF377 family glycosyl hydrolase
MLDLHRPELVIAELPGVLLSPDQGERDGYVPYVVYSCGALLHAGTIWLPYGAGDARVGLASVAVSALLNTMEQRSPDSVEPRLSATTKAGPC